MKCLDTYALVEINNGNSRFVSLLDEDIVITDITLVEFYGNMYRKYNKKTADYWYRKLVFFCKSVSREVLLKAIIYRIDNLKENLSFFDCVGYIFAREHKISFVTGDSAFNDKEGVEFIG